MSVWGALVAQLGLKPDLRRVGPGTASVDFIGLVAGAWLSLAFDPTGRPRLTIARERALVVMAEEAWRMGPRAQVPGFAGGLRTGDDVFDDAVLVLAQGGHGPLALLDGRTRSRVARLVIGGGGCAPERVWLDPPALAAAQDATQARALIDQAIEVLAALAPPTRETLIDRALSEEPAPVRAAARAGLEGRITAEELLPRLPPEDSSAVVAQILA
ncbi:MAG: hypothetical protein KC613_06910, partial [Myxococcales bacterium]|nr:hypothetical protein [Myxococcales bacterium]